MKTLIFPMVLALVGCTMLVPPEEDTEEVPTPFVLPDPLVEARPPGRMAIDCQPCEGWWEIGERWSICAGPSEDRFEAKLACIESTCAGPCSSWVTSYEACMVGSDPTCSWTVGDACNACQAATNADGGCLEQLVACGADRLGCVTCSEWRGGGDVQRVCGGAPFNAALGLRVCACTGPCAASCTAECTRGYPDFTAPISGTCSSCLGSSCFEEQTTCLAN